MLFFFPTNQSDYYNQIHTDNNSNYKIITNRNNTSYNNFIFLDNHNETTSIEYKQLITYVFSEDISEFKDMLNNPLTLRIYTDEAYSNIIMQKIENTLVPKYGKGILDYYVSINGFDPQQMGTIFFFYNRPNILILLGSFLLISCVLIGINRLEDIKIRTLLGHSNIKIVNNLFFLPIIKTIGLLICTLFIFFLTILDLTSPLLINFIHYYISNNWIILFFIPIGMYLLYYLFVNWFRWYYDHKNSFLSIALYSSMLVFSFILVVLLIPLSNGIKNLLVSEKEINHLQNNLLYKEAFTLEQVVENSIDSSLNSNEFLFNYAQDNEVPYVNSYSYFVSSINANYEIYDIFINSTSPSPYIIVNKYFFNYFCVISEGECLTSSNIPSESQIQLISTKLDKHNYVENYTPIPYESSEIFVSRQNPFLPLENYDIFIIESYDEEILHDNDNVIVYSQTSLNALQKELNINGYSLKYRLN